MLCNAKPSRGKNPVDTAEGSMLDVPTLMFHSLPSRRLSEEIARQIKQAILSGQFKPGDKLPTEREMVAQFCTSRVSVREAVRSLEHFGLVRIKRGAGGGTYVMGADYRPVAESFRVKMQLSQGTLDHLTEARLLLEPGLCRLAARHATAEDLERLRAVVEEQETIVRAGQEARSYDLKFHRILIESAHNPVLALTAVSVIELLVGALEHAHVGGGLTLHVVNFHRVIYNALSQRDGARASRLMTEHVADIQSRLQSLLDPPAARAIGPARVQVLSWDH